MPVAVPKKTKKKAEKLSTITNRMDSLTSRIVRLRDRACIVCGSTDNLQCGHFISRVFVNVRWSLMNCNCQCASCNVSHEQDTVPYTLAMIRRYGIKAVEGLSVVAHNPKKLSRLERLDLEGQLRVALHKLEKENT